MNAHLVTWKDIQKHGLTKMQKTFIYPKDLIKYIVDTINSKEYNISPQNFIQMWRKKRFTDAEIHTKASEIERLSFGVVLRYTKSRYNIE